MVAHATDDADQPPDGVESESQTCSPRLREAKPIRPVAEVSVAAGDPVAGRFTLQDAIRGLSGRWPLLAELHTDRGVIRCELWDQVAPITVANFVGLARGLRPFKEPSSDRWVRRAAYDGTIFHRVIPDFIIQGGDLTGTGAGSPGYVIPNEIDESVRPDRRGLLYMAHRGPNTNDMQFFILDGPAPHVAGGYTAFGECAPASVIREIATAPRSGERPDPPIRMRRVEVKLSPGC